MALCTFFAHWSPLSMTVNLLAEKKSMQVSKSSKPEQVRFCGVLQFSNRQSAKLMVPCTISYSDKTRSACGQAKLSLWESVFLFYCDTTWQAERKLRQPMKAVTKTQYWRWYCGHTLGSCTAVGLQTHEVRELLCSISPWLSKQSCRTVPPSEKALHTSTVEIALFHF